MIEPIDSTLEIKLVIHEIKDNKVLVTLERTVDGAQLETLVQPTWTEVGGSITVMQRFQKP